MPVIHSPTPGARLRFLLGTSTTLTSNLATGTPKIYRPVPASRLPARCTMKRVLHIAHTCMQGHTTAYKCIVALARLTCKRTAHETNTTRTHTLTHTLTRSHTLKHTHAHIRSHTHTLTHARTHARARASPPPDLTLPTAPQATFGVT